MAHGGLRYLENREFKLVAESARERNRLLNHAAHFTRPLEVAVPLPTFLRGLPGSILRFLGFDWKGSTFSTAGLKIALTLYEYLGREGRALRATRPSSPGESFRAGWRGVTRRLSAISMPASAIRKRWCWR